MSRNAAVQQEWLKRCVKRPSKDLGCHQPPALWLFCVITTSSDNFEKILNQLVHIHESKHFSRYFIWYFIPDLHDRHHTPNKQTLAVADARQTRSVYADVIDNRCRINGRTSARSRYSEASSALSRVLIRWIDCFKEYFILTSMCQSTVTNKAITDR